MRLSNEKKSSYCICCWKKISMLWLINQITILFSNQWMLWSWKIFSVAAIPEFASASCWTEDFLRRRDFSAKGGLKWNSEEEGGLAWFSCLNWRRRGCLPSLFCLEELFSRKVKKRKMVSLYKWRKPILAYFGKSIEVIKDSCKRYLGWT